MPVVNASVRIDSMLEETMAAFREFEDKVFNLMQVFGEHPEVAAAAPQLRVSLGVIKSTCHMLRNHRAAGMRSRVEERCANPKQL